MKILFLSHYFPPEGNAPASRVHSMCRRWVTAGHDVTVVTCAPNVPRGVVYDGYQNAWRTEETLDGIRVVRGWTYLAANQGTVKRILSYVSYFCMALWRSLRLPGTDLVIATSPQFFCGWAGVWVARLKRSPFVLEIRDIWPESIDAVGALGRSGGAGIRGLPMRYLEWLERRMYLAADHIVTVGDGYRSKLLERGVPREKIDVITNGVEHSRFLPTDPDPQVREEAGAQKGDFLVGYIGTVGLAHGLEVVIEAGRLARERGLQRLRFVVLGDGARLAALRALLGQNDPGNVRFLGWRPRSEVPGWLASIDACLVHLRSAEIFRSVLPSKIFEALAMRRPVLLGVRGQAEALLRASGGGLCFEPDDPSGLVDVAFELMENPELCEDLGSAGREHVLAHFELDTLAERYESLLTDLHRDHRGPGTVG